MKNKFRAVLILVPIFLTGCSAIEEPEQTKTYLIVDQTSNKAINAYDYSLDDNTLVRTISYDEREQIKKHVTYEYDNNGNLIKTVEKAAGAPEKTVTYITDDFYDDRGYLIKTVRTSSDGDLVETYYGYDENNFLRGVVEQVNQSSTLMKDY
ncbi:MAG: hypothetical protein JXR86_17555 [Spirochaetales bacterium]|nr:hypothetical protein [Spirochaetales bacterium]